MLRCFTSGILLCFCFPLFAQWSSLSFATGFNVVDVNYFGDTLVVNLGGQVFISTDGGRTVTYLSEGANLDFAAYSHYLNGSLYVASANSRIYRYNGPSDSWAEATVAERTGDAFAALVATDDLLFGVHPASRIYRSTDGDSWEIIDLGAVTFPDNPTLTSGIAIGDTLLAGLQGGVLRSTDEGATWAYVQIDEFDTQVVRLVTDAQNRLYAGTSGDGVYVSSDGGLQWTVVGGGPPAEGRGNVLDLEVADTDMYMTTSTAPTDSSNLYRLNTATDQWEALCSDGDRFIADQLASNGTTLYAGTGEDGVFSRPLDQFAGTSCLTTSLLSPPSVTNVAVYPNPAVQQLFLTDASASGPLTYRLYDAGGCLVLSGVMQSPGQPINVAALPAGVYSLQYVSDRRLHTARFLKQ